MQDFAGLSREHERAFKTIAACGFDEVELRAGTFRWEPLGRPERIVQYYGSIDAFLDVLHACAIKRVSSVFFDPGEPIFEELSFARDPLNADKPFTMLAEVMKKESAAKPQVTSAQRKLLESRYNLSAHPDPSVTMARGKPLAVGPTARLAEGVTWETLATLSVVEIKKRGLFPYPSLPHPLHVNGGQYMV